MGIRNAAAALALAIQLLAVISTDPPGCPTGPGSSTSTNCVVAGRQSSLIGLANFKTPIVGDNLTWTETVGYDNTSSTPQFSFERSFYLGAPQGSNLTANVASSNFGACAVFFTDISAEAKFPGENIRTSFGTWINANYANDLIKQAQLAVGPTSNLSSCKSLKAEITKNLPLSCSKIATGDGVWNGIKDLTGPNAPKPLTAAESSTSTCYPTLPKTNSLTKVASFNGNSSRQLNDQASKFISSR